MKGDFTRFTFDPSKHYDSVLNQQGRVQTDADWNEQVMIAAHRNRIEMLDIIGPTGAPQDLSVGGLRPFLVYYGPDKRPGEPETNRIFINHGRYYVDGLMVESEGPVRYDRQPGVTLPPSGAGAYLIYLDVWKRHITSLEDPDIREVALAGADSGTRSQIVWQPRMEKIGDLSKDLASVNPSQYGPDWQPTGTVSSGALDVQAGSTPLENQLYRVEVHRGGSRGTASFKWSRDNGTVVARLLSHTPPVLTTITRDGVSSEVWVFSVTIDQTGRDSFSSFLPGHMVELSNEEFILQRKPGVFGSVTKVTGDSLNLEVPKNSAQLLHLAAASNPLVGTIQTVRRWDNTWNPDLSTVTLANVGADFTQGDRLLLERDVTVRFANSSNGQTCKYQTGDYWLIPARTVSDLEDWVAGEQKPPAGELHFYAPLALVKLQTDGTIATPAADLRDMRDVFPTLRSLVGGTGSIVQGTGTKNRLPKWQSDDGSVLLTSNLTDDGSTISLGGSALTVTPDATFQSKLKVGTATGSQAIKMFSDGVLDTSATEVVPTSQAIASFITARGFGSGVANKMVRWTGTNTISTSRITDDNSTPVKVDGNTEVTGTLKLGTASDAQTIKRFTNSAIKSMSSQDLSETVPTAVAVKEYVDNLLAGSVTAFAMDTAPDGWLECNGQAISRTTYSRLFQKIGTRFGAGNASTTFNVPDLRGEFIRGWDHERQVDTGRALGSSQLDQLQTHKHADSGHAHSDSGHSHSDSGHYHSDSGHAHSDSGHSHSDSGHYHSDSGHKHGYYHGNFSWPGGNGAETTAGWEHGDYHGDFTGYASITKGYAAIGFGYSAITKGYAGIQAASANIQKSWATIQTAYAVIGDPTGSRNGSETRPRNVALMYCIKF